jgi:transcriptional regulator with XRE-family HTH domain
MLGHVIREHRNKLGYTRDGFARLVGVSGPAVTRWERDEATPSYKKFARIAQLFGMTTSQLQAFADEAEACTALGVVPEVNAERAYAIKALEDLAVLLPDGTVDANQLELLRNIVKSMNAMLRTIQDKPQDDEQDGCIEDGDEPPD